MAVKEDAGEILAYIYQVWKEKNQTPNRNEIEKVIGWDEHRINQAKGYLKQKGLIKAANVISGDYLLIDITAEGIDVIENKDEFEDIFGVTLNLGILQLHWNRKN